MQNVLFTESVWSLPPIDPLEAVVERIPPLFPHQEVFEFFQRIWQDRSASFLPIVSQDQKPLGIIRDIDVKEHAYSRFGLDLLRNPNFGKKLKDFIFSVPVAERHSSIEHLLELFAYHEDLDGVIIVENGYYYGILSAHSMLKLLNRHLACSAQNNGDWAIQNSHNPLLQEYLAKAWELQTAAKIQQSLLPKAMPQAFPLKLAAFLQSASETGGDWYGFMTKFPHTLGILIGDVTGHGTPSALVTAAACAACRTLENIFALTPEKLSPAEMLTHLNQAIGEAGGQKYLMSFLVMWIDLTTGIARFANAGHPSPLLIKPNGVVKTLFNVGPLLGYTAHASFEVSEVQLQVGDQLFFYTDGLTENTNPQGKMWGERQLKHRLKRYAGFTPERLMQQLVEDVQAFYAGQMMEDDLTMVACQVEAPFEYLAN